MRALFVLAVAGVVCAGCSRDARLYPANLNAGKQALHAHFTDSGLGKGPVEIAMPDGEVLKGEFTTTDTSNYTTGSIFSSAGSHSLFSSGSASSVPGSMPGVVNAIGPAGTTMRCEYAVNTWSGSGSGQCETNKGAEYQLQF